MNTNKKNAPDYDFVLKLGDWCTITPDNRLSRIGVVPGKLRRKRVPGVTISIDNAALRISKKFFSVNFSPNLQAVDK